MCSTGVSFHGRQADVRLLDLQSREVAFGLNLFACPSPAKVSRTASRVVEVFKKVWGEGSWGPRLEDLLANAAHTLVANPGATLADQTALLTEPARRKRYVSRLSTGVVRDFWVNEYDQMKPGMQQQVYGPLMNKVRAFLRDPLLYDIVSQPKSSLDLREAIEANNIVLVRLDSDQEEATSLLGGILLQQLQEAAFARRDMSRADRTPFMVYFDECQLFATPTFVKLMREVRKFGLGVTAATQLDSALPEDVATAFSGSSTVVCFRLTDRDAKRLQHRFDGSALASDPILDPDPLGTLLSRGHLNPDLVVKARKIELVLSVWQNRRDAMLKVYGERYYAPSIATVMRQVRQQIDAFLYAYMRATITKPISLKQHLDALNWALCDGWNPKGVSRSDDVVASDLQVASVLEEAVWDLAKALLDYPLFMGRESDRSRIVHELTHLPAYHALVSYQHNGVSSEALIGSLNSLPGPTFRPQPLGIKREPLPPPPEEFDESIFFDDPDAPPPFVEPR